jgi:hypothetical protein
MIDRDEFLMDCVISVASDDYESFEIIFEQTRRLAALKGMDVTEGDVAKAIERAIANGLTEAYMLSPHKPHSIKAQYSPELLHELWFYVTPHGKTTAKSMPELGGEDILPRE